MGKPNYDKFLHANRKHTTPYNNNGPKDCFSRSDILSGRLPTHFGNNYPSALTNPYSPPRDWYKQGRCLKVPKVVVLSSVPFWTLLWEQGYMYGPRDVIGQMFTPPYAFGNYYYFEQWDLVNSTSTLDTNEIWRTKGNPKDCTGGDYPDHPDAYGAGNSKDSNSYFNNFDNGAGSDDYKKYYDTNYLTGEHQTGTANTMQQCWPPNNPSNMFPPCKDCKKNDLTMLPQSSGPAAAPTARYHQIVCRLQNQYFQYHQQMLQAFMEAKIALESDPKDPIYVVIPEWVPPEIYQIRNSYLLMPTEEKNWQHGEDCTVADIIPCHTYYNAPWGPPYPNVNDSRNYPDYDGPTCPWLHCPEPGFGTNVLHMYCGHPCVRYYESNNPFEMQAWPLTPEGNYIGPLLNGNYLGNTAQPYFAGRRAVWRDLGFDYGYMNHGAQGVYNYYAPIIEAAADKRKQNFLKYRQFETRIFTFPQGVNRSWNLDAIRDDRKQDCDATQFYFGFEFDDFASMHSNEDISYINCASQNGGLRVATAKPFFPDAQSIRDATSKFYPPIQKRVNDYYNGIEPGSEEEFQIAIERNGLGKYGVQYGGAADAMLTAGGIIEYVREHFKQYV